jgi:hypothetical protein
VIGLARPVSEIGGQPLPGLASFCLMMYQRYILCVYKAMLKYIFYIHLHPYICYMETPKPNKHLQLNIKASKEEKELAEKVATARGLSISGLVRLLILDEARRLGIS